MSLPFSGRGLRAVAVCLAALGPTGCSVGLLGGGSGGDSPVMISAAQARATPARSTTAGFDGLVIADEPVAAEAARRILARGGSAADAATALYFALSVTYPSAASLGGGGVCLVHDAGKGHTYSLDFLPREPQRTGFAAVPGNVKGFEELHRRHGRLGWSAVIEPAADLAEDGFRVSDALAQRLAGARNVLREDEGLRELFLGKGGMPLAEGERVRQKPLAKTLDKIQDKGSRALYGGQRAKALMEETEGRLTLEDLEQYAPVWTPAQEVEVAPGRRFFIPAARTGAGAFLEGLLREAHGQRISSAAGLRELAEELLRRHGAPRGLPADFGSTAFLVMHGKGDAVACGLTMNGPFGAGRYSQATGLVFARAPSLGPFGLGGAFLSPVMQGGGEDGLLTLVVVGAGGPRAAAATVYTAMAARPGTGQSLADVILNNGSGPLDLVNAGACAGVKVGNRCEMALDPNGFGLAVEAARDE